MASSALITRMFALAGLGLAFGAAHSFKHEIVLAKTTSPAPATTGAGEISGSPTTPANSTKQDLSLAEAKAMWDEGVTFIDARPDRDYNAGRIAGALHITPGGFGRPEAIEKLQFLDMEKPVIVYCTGGDCHDSHNLVALLTDYGFKKCHILTDGYPAWETAGYEIENSEGGQ